jgi:hypothetical protein
VAFELPAPPHHAQGDPALEVVTCIDLALTALDVFGVDQSVVPLCVPSFSLQTWVSTPRLGRSVGKRAQSYLLTHVEGVLSSRTLMLHHELQSLPHVML